VVLDLAGRWVTPGLIDTHQHLFDLKSARALVAAGVTTARTMHADHFVDIGMRQLHRGGATDLPDVLASGYQLRPDMFVFEAFFLDFPELANLIKGKVTVVQNVRRLIQANVWHWVDQIKILATERSGTPDADAPTTFTRTK
jgi:imidazolonepropionase-like amidohydrolase